jgi:hypothetical protein
VTQPLDRNTSLPELGKVDRAAGEFWVENPFMMPAIGANLSAYERNRLFLNSEGKSFVDASFTSGADLDSDSRSVVAADFNRDGTPDLLVGSTGGGPLRLFLNRFPDGSHRVRIVLQGKTSNHQGIGSRIVIEADGRKIVRDVFPVNGCMGTAPAELIAGVGQATRIDRMTLRWPTGEVQEFKDLPIDCQLILKEGAAEYSQTPLGLIMTR